MDDRPRPSLLLVGPTGSGKTPLGQELERRGLGGRSCVHFDFGAVLREIASDPRASEGLEAEDIESVRSSLATGALFEDRDVPMILRVLRGFMARRRLGTGELLVLNGLPRHRKQARDLAGVVAVERLVHLEADASVIRERIRLDPGGDRAARSDDSMVAVERRWAAYGERTLPLVEHYRRAGVPVHVLPVTAAMTAGEMYDALARIMDGEDGACP